MEHREEIFKLLLLLNNNVLLSEDSNFNLCKIIILFAAIFAYLYNKKNIIFSEKIL